MRLVFVFIAVSVLGSSAMAANPDYCAAYARDFADQIKDRGPQWQRRYDNAQASCMTRLSGTEATATAPPSQPKQQPKPQSKSVPPKAIAQPTEPPAPPKKKTVAAVSLYSDSVKPDLKPGSPEWIDYCSKKYTSFDAKKGTYLSRTGVVRKCLVTADGPQINAAASAPAKPKAKPPAKN